MNLEQVIAGIEKRFSCVIGLPTHIAQTGEPYVEIGIQSGLPDVSGTVGEGSAQELGFDDETAIMGFISAFESYADGRSGTLYWRILPELESAMIRRFLGDRGMKRTRVYCRLLISDKPVIYPDMEAYLNSKREVT